MEELKSPGKRRRNPKYFTVSEIAEIMGLSEGAVQWNIRKKFLPATYTGYKYLIEPGDFRRWRELYYGDDDED